MELLVLMEYACSFRCKLFELLLLLGLFPNSFDQDFGHLTVVLPIKRLYFFAALQQLMDDLCPHSLHKFLSL